MSTSDRQLNSLEMLQVVSQLRTRRLVVLPGMLPAGLPGRRADVPGHPLLTEVARRVLGGEPKCVAAEAFTAHSAYLELVAASSPIAIRLINGHGAQESAHLLAGDVLVLWQPEWHWVTALNLGDRWFYLL